MTTKISEQLINCIKTKLCLTNRLTGNINWLVEAYEANPDNPPGLVETCMEHITSENVGTTSTFDIVMMRLRMISNWEEVEAEQSQALKEVLVLAAPFRDSKEGVTERKAILLKDHVQDYIESLDTNVQKVLVWLVLQTGVKPMDLMRDDFKLTQVSKGIIKVGKQLNPSHSQPRTVRFNSSYINEVLDPDGEHTRLIASAVFNYEDAGLKSREWIGLMLSNTVFNFYQLRASHVIHCRQAGESWIEIANRLGVKNPNNLKRSILEYAAANGIQLD